MTTVADQLKAKIAQFDASAEAEIAEVKTKYASMKAPIEAELAADGVHLKVEVTEFEGWMAAKVAAVRSWL